MGIESYIRKQIWLCAGIIVLSSALAGANMVITPWTPLFKGIDHATGTNFPDGTIPRLQVVNCLRIDLTDPDVQLFTTPRIANYAPESRETASLSASNFVKQYGVKVATVANFYTTAQGPDPSAEGLPCQVYGLAISAGQIVSVPDYGPDSNNRRVSLLFTTNKQAFLVLSNAPPGISTTGIYTAVTGYYPVLTNGVVLGGILATLYPDDTIHNIHPRTIYGLSQDRHYLYLLIIDGRQTGYSEGASDAESGLWLLAFGGWDGVNMDGGGSTSMYKADCAGNPIALGHSSYVGGLGFTHERFVGSHLGVFAPPLPSFINDVAATPGSLSANIAWNTWSNATSQVEYGTTTNYGTLTPLDTNLLTSHSVTISNLSPLTRYYFRVLSFADGELHSAACNGLPFSTTNFAGGMLFPITNAWKYTTGNMDGLNWQAPAYNDAGWSNGLAALWAHNGASLASSTNLVPNLITRMPIGAAGYPFSTYYFRTKFNYPALPSGATLIFSNFIDDGAVFHLNGVEIQRVNMPAPPATILNGTYAAGLTCTNGPNPNNASCPIVFALSSDILTNLVTGTNWLAVEAHNAAEMSSDVVFQSALFYTLSPPPQLPPFFTNIVVLPGETNAVLTWTTLSNSTTEVLYGPTPLLGSSSSPDANLVTEHAAALTGLVPLTEYFYRLVSLVGTNEFVFDGTFTTVPFHQSLLAFSDSWKFTTNNLDGVNWTDLEYDDSGWLGEGPALLYFENNPAVGPLSTPVPVSSDGPYTTYYFRTYFSVTNPIDGFALLFTNYIDDGAVFYLNGVEIQRVRMPPGPISNATYASACPLNNCEATRDVPDVFRIGGSWMTNVATSGVNALAVEVHQRSAESTDIVFGSMVGLVRAVAGEVALRVTTSNGVTQISWPGEYLTLQHCTNLTNLSGANGWVDVPGPVRSSPYCLTNPVGATFYRLRN